MRLELVRKMSRPPERSSRFASGIHRYGSAQRLAPYSLIARSNAASGNGTDSPGASTSGNSIPVSRCMRRAVSSWAGVGPTPTGRAPRFASQAEKYAVPQPSSTTSRPATSPMQPMVDSWTPKTPQEISLLLHWRGAAAAVCSSFAFVQAATLPGSDSGELIAEPERDLARCRLGRVGAVHEVVRHRHREIPANRARLRVGGVRRADRLAHRRDRSLALDHERPRRPRGAERDELAEERLLLVLGVMRLAQIAARGEELAREHGEAAALDARQDVAGETAPHGIRLDQDHGPLTCHGAAL